MGLNRATSAVLGVLALMTGTAVLACLGCERRSGDTRPGNDEVAPCPATVPAVVDSAPRHTPAAAASDPVTWLGLDPDKLDPDVKACLARARQLESQGRAEDAIGELHRGRAAHPETEGVLVLAEADIHFRTGDKTRTVELLHEALRTLELSPEEILLDADTKRGDFWLPGQFQEMLEERQQWDEQEWDVR